jgi:hypothetical protein
MEFGFLYQAAFVAASLVGEGRKYAHLGIKRADSTRWLRQNKQRENVFFLSLRRTMLVKKTRKCLVFTKLKSFKLKQNFDETVNFLPFWQKQSHLTKPIAHSSLYLHCRVRNQQRN